MPGVARQLVTFFASPKKGDRVATAPLRGVPKKAGTETGRTGNSPSAQTTCPSLSVSAPAFLASSKAELRPALPYLVWLACEGCIQSKFSVIPAKAGIRGRVGSRLRGNDVLAIASGDIALGKLPMKECGKWIRNEACLSRRRVCLVSHFPHSFIGNPRRGQLMRSPFFAYFFWRSKKSEQLPGCPRRRYLRERKSLATMQRRLERMADWAYIRSYFNFFSARFATSNVASTIASSCAAETNPASNAEGAKYTPSSSIA